MVDAKDFLFMDGFQAASLEMEMGCGSVYEFCMEHDWQFKYLTNESHRHLTYALIRLPGESE